MKNNLKHLNTLFRFEPSREIRTASFDVLIQFHFDLRWISMHRNSFIVQLNRASDFPVRTWDADFPSCHLGRVNTCGGIVIVTLFARSISPFFSAIDYPRRRSIFIHNFSLAVADTCVTSA